MEKKVRNLKKYSAIDSSMECKTLGMNKNDGFHGKVGA